jgi:two-component sensor histidine kinase
MAGESVGLDHVGDHQVLRRDGGRRWVVWHNTLVRDEHGRIIGTLSAGEDVTERRDAEQRVKASLQEKEVLLREIHHRVKNNLQVISSLLTLEAHHHTGASGAQLFADTQSRIRAMALVHDKLYQSDNLAKIDLGAYIRDLAAGLQGVIASGHRDVRVVIEADDIGLSVDTAMPCGLVLNELMTNAFKYAFPDGRSGEIRVEARHLEDGRVGILVGDDGVGLSPEIGLESTRTLGLQLVRAVTSQLRGKVAVERGPGTRFRISFPLSPDTVAGQNSLSGNRIEGARGE